MVGARVGWPSPRACGLAAWQLPASCRSAGTECCPVNWVDHEGGCYWFSSVGKTWAEADEYCRLENAHLLVINSWDEQVRPSPQPWEAGKGSCHFFVTKGKVQKQNIIELQQFHNGAALDAKGQEIAARSWVGPGAQVTEFQAGWPRGRGCGQAHGRAESSFTVLGCGGSSPSGKREGEAVAPLQSVGEGSLFCASPSHGYHQTNPST